MISATRIGLERQLRAVPPCDDGLFRLIRRQRQHDLGALAYHAAELGIAQGTVVEVGAQRDDRAQAAVRIAQGDHQAVEEVEAGRFVLDQREQLLELVDDQHQLDSRLVRQDALDGAHQAALVLAELGEQLRDRRAGRAQQRRFELLQRVGAGQHLDHDPALGARQRALTQRRDDARLDHAGFAAPARPDHRQEPRHRVRLAQAADQLGDERVAPEEVVGVFFLEGAQAFVRIAQRLGRFFGRGQGFGFCLDQGRRDRPGFSRRDIRGRRQCVPVVFGVLAQEFVHLVAPVRGTPQQRLVHQVEQRRQRDVRHAARRFVAEAARQRREPFEHFLLTGGEHVPRLVEDGAQAAVALRHVLQRGHQEVEVALDLADDLAGREHLHPGRRQLDAERHPLHQLHDAAHGGARRLVERELGPDAPRALHEQLGGAVQRTIAGGLHAVDLEQPLAMQVQALARRDQQLHFGRMGEEFGQHARRLEHLLEVVQYQQHLFVAQVIQQLGALVLRPVEGRLERVDDGRDQQVGRGDRRQLDGVHTLLEGVDLLGSDL